MLQLMSVDSLALKHAGLWAAYGTNKCFIVPWAPFDIDHPTFLDT